MTHLLFLGTSFGTDDKTMDFCASPKAGNNRSMRIRVFISINLELKVTNNDRKVIVKGLLFLQFRSHGEAEKQAANRKGHLEDQED